MRVLITRPRCFAASLSEKIQALPALPLLFPVLEFAPIMYSKKLQDTLQSLAQRDIVIFSSQAAVHFFMKSLTENKIDLPKLQWMAIGKSTAFAFQQMAETRGYLGLSCSFPNPPFESESLLAHPDLEKVKNKNILILRGQTGRRLLPDTLNLRGAQVTELAIYHRLCPNHSPAETSKILETLKPDVLITTSQEGLKNLVTLLGEKNWQIYSKLPMIVVGERMKRLALSLQASELLIAKGAEDAAMIEVLQSLRSRYP